jgi:hypothetical protein
MGGLLFDNPSNRLPMLYHPHTVTPIELGSKPDNLAGRGIADRVGLLAFYHHRGRVRRGAGGLCGPVRDLLHLAGTQGGRPHPGPTGSHTGRG